MITIPDSMAPGTQEFFCTATYYFSLKEGRKPSKLNTVLWLELLCHVWIFQCVTLTRISKVFCLRENWLRDNKTGFLESKNKCMTTSKCGGHPKRFYTTHLGSSIRTRQLWGTGLITKEIWDAIFPAE